MNRRVDQALDIECVPTTLIVFFFLKKKIKKIKGFSDRFHCLRMG